MSTKMVFGSAIAFILLGLYVYLVWSATAFAVCKEGVDCNAVFNDKMASALSLIAGLVGALVIAELAVSKPGEAPVARVLMAQPSELAKRILTIVTLVYLGVWVLGGLGALLMSFRYAGIKNLGVESLTSLGESWFGLAIAAAYSYFGINRP